MLTIWQRIGLTAFLIGFALFIATLSLSRYTLTDKVLSETVSKEQLDAIRSATASMHGKTYTSSFGFVADYRTAIARLNEAYKQRNETNLLIPDYAFLVTKSASTGFFPENSQLFFWLSLLLSVGGGLLYILPTQRELPGIKNNGIYHSPATNRGWIGIVIGTFLIGFYIVLYFFPEYLTNWVLMFDPLSRLLNGGPASQWFVYGTLYTLVILVMGVRMLIKYRHSRYQQLRTLSVMFFQTAFAFLIPELLALFHQPAQDLKNMWPLDYSFYFDYRIDEKIKAGTLGMFMLVWGTALWLLGVPILTYFFGKRWYCSWVCGCGGLAETLGDPYRQLSDKRLGAWKLERIVVHSVLVFAVVMTALVMYTYLSGQTLLFGFLDSNGVRSVYGSAIGAVFAGVVGTGFYPILGSRVWCRFGCPLAAYLGLVQRFKSRFRITTNGGQCISCGNCSTYCEMGIDVRWYAQRGQDIVRSSCVGCGICSAVCPRGVLNLENDSITTRQTNPGPILLGNNSFRIQQ
ncbi:4Fe-4S binding protein [Spirosoma sp. BT702]|uniref:4Fe-4S binding protein n=1 Tax=Spirosoma profusum TaxID=2771354 RepID=A0A927AWA7_9BACT|nr:4Fe-4S dicluster domain-containing protein [Spirosoma profusum]MBD2705569.1 4Fe-4S binding protein [Spirosoma profusum]